MSKSSGARSWRSTSSTWKKFNTLVICEKQPTPGQFTPHAGRPLTTPGPYVTVWPTRVSTSAKKGAMIDLRVVLRLKGVNVPRDESKVRLPLLLMKTDVNVFPKNLAVSPRGTGPIEPSS